MKKGNERRENEKRENTKAVAMRSESQECQEGKLRGLETREE